MDNRQIDMWMRWKKSNSSFSANTTEEIKEDLWVILDHIPACSSIFHMLQKLVLESNLLVTVSIRCFRRKLGPSGFFSPQSAIFFIEVLFLMVSINMCRVISAFITQGGFLVMCNPRFCFWTETGLIVAGGNYGACRLLSAMSDIDKMLWLASCLKGQTHSFYIPQGFGVVAL